MLNFDVIVAFSFSAIAVFVTSLALFMLGYYVAITIERNRQQRHPTEPTSKNIEMIEKEKEATESFLKSQEKPVDDSNETLKLAPEDK